MKKLVLSGMALALVIGGASLVMAAVESGLPVGEQVGPYHVLDVTGPSAGKKLCYRCQYGSQPVVNIFTRTVDEPVITLIKQLDQKMNEEKKLKAFVTVLTDNTDATSEQLKKVAKENDIKNVPLTVFENQAGPETYKISKDAAVTVMMWVNSEVKVNHAYENGKLCDDCVKTIVADVSKILK